MLKLSENKVVNVVTLMLILASSITFTISARAADQTPDSVIKDFYKWYINTIDSGVEPTVKGRPTLKRFITVRLLKQVDREEKFDDADVDSILPTQEWDKTWANSVKVSKLTVKGVTATAIVTFRSESYPKLLISLVQEAGVWKIDRVKDVSQ
jgi:hypothetical protein